MKPDYDAIRASDGAILRLRASHPSLIDLSTSRVERLLAALGNPHLSLPPVIHVAGTNGKGSTTAFMRAIAEAAGLQVHVLTSPHLVRFAERVRIAGSLISDQDLALLIDEVEAANAGLPISFFEITTVLALHAFAQTAADLCLVEVGLGGRFDATNVFAAPAVSVITPVDLDHLEMLGPELEKIAWEKAGIIKAGRPVMLGRQSETAGAVIKAEAARVGAPITAFGQDFDAYEAHGRMALQMPDGLLDLLAPNLFGPHQVENAGLAAMAMLALGDRRIDETAIAVGMTTAQWPGRFQRLTAGPLAAMARNQGADLWLDGAHNPHAARALAQACQKLSARDGRPVALIVGMLGRKDARGFFDAFSQLNPQVYATVFSSESATPAKTLAQAATAAGLTAMACKSVEEALALALDGPTSHVIICGSLHFIGDVLAQSPETWPT